ncbi:ATP-dependent endonuclease [Corynebacterium sp. KPL2734]|uniref:ATP-dependent nuclease n=1 Tax=Corynebacterium sp. KPL2734 TaxID=3158312 RepID=UPI0032F0565F
MKIKSLSIKNFRAIADFKQEFGSYTAFIGYNGGGKSSILHAVRWFFDDFELEPSDVFSKDLGQDDRAALPYVKVTVTFDDLSKVDRENFGPYALKDEITLSRVGGVGKKSKLYGERLVCEEFTKLRKETKVAEVRKRLQELIITDDSFSDLQSFSKSPKNEILKALEDWELKPENREALTPIEDEDANHFFGAVGSEKLKADAGFVFIPAAPDLTGQFDVSGKGSAVQLLLGDILKGVVGQSISKWTEENQEVLNQLEATVKESAASRLKDRAHKVNRHLERYLPDTQIEFEVGLQDWAPKASPSAISKMHKGGREFPIEREGHGVQRATLLALLQATADSRSETPPPNEDPEAVGLGDPRNSLIVFIEEPEVYQHPVQARLMARSFVNASHMGNVQFVVATHSPYFLDPTQLERTFRVESSRAGSKVHRPRFEEDLTKKLENGDLDKYFLESITESLFSQAALVVEGDTERAIFDTMPCDNSGLTLRDLGISVAVAGGANSLLDMARIIRAFGVPTLVVRDGDSDRDIAM